MDRLFWDVRASGRRTRAVIVCWRERASVMTWAPVRPLAPRRRMRIMVIENCMTVEDVEGGGFNWFQPGGYE